MNTTYPLHIIDIQCLNRTFHVIQDTVLPAGTKQRGIKFFQKLKEDGILEVVTYGTVYGYGQVATAWCCKEVGLLCTIFLPQTFPMTTMTKKTIKLGASIVEVPDDNGYPTTSVLAKKARSYSLGDPDRKLIELGLDDPDFISALASGISDVKHNVDPKRIWVAGGSGVLARALSKAFPHSHICIVQVGRKIYEDVLNTINHTLYISPEPFRKNAVLLPPYQSLRHYDAKVWSFARKYGNDGDYIWNVK